MDLQLVEVHTVVSSSAAKRNLAKQNPILNPMLAQRFLRGIPPFSLEAIGRMEDLGELR